MAETRFQNNTLLLCVTICPVVNKEKPFQVTLKNEMWHLPERAEMDLLQPTFPLIDSKSHSPSLKKKKLEKPS